MQVVMLLGNCKQPAVILYLHGMHAVWHDMPNVCQMSKSKLSTLCAYDFILFVLLLLLFVLQRFYGINAMDSCIISTI